MNVDVFFAEWYVLEVLKGYDEVDDDAKHCKLLEKV